MAQEDPLDNLLENAFQLRNEGKADSSFILLNQALELADQRQDMEAKCMVLIRFGGLMNSIHKYKRVRDYYSSAYKLARTIADNLLIGKSLLGLGTIHHFKALESESLQFQDSVSIFYDSALYYYYKSEEFLKLTDDRQNLIGAKNNIGSILLDRNEVAKASQYFSEGLKLSLAEGDTLITVQSLFHMANLFFNAKNYKQGLEYLDQSQKLAEIKKYRKRLADIAKRKGEIYYDLSRFKESAENFRARDSLALYTLDEDYNNKILELETKYSTASTERDNAQKQSQIEKQSGQMILLASGIGLVALMGAGSFFYNEQRKKTIRAVARHDKQVNERKVTDLLSQQEIKTTYALLEGQDQERQRIGKELHDNISSTLSTLKMFVESFSSDTLTQKQSEMMQRITTITEKAGEDTRQLSHALDSGLLRHFGLSAAVSDLVDTIHEASSCEVQLTDELSQPITGEVAMNTYRIVQELINNTLKHAQASQIKIVLQKSNGSFTLHYQDDGIGFDRNASKEGIGLKNMISRVDNHHGKIEFDTKKGHGCSVLVEVPLDRNAN